MSRLIALTCAAFVALGAVAYAAASRPDGSTPAPASVVHAVTHVPVATLNTVGKGKAATAKSGWGIGKLKGKPLTKGGKPEVIAGALAWCPHCAADNWALGVALSRFGSFHGLGTVDTGTFYEAETHSKQAFNHTKGLDFYKATYSSRYIAFTNIELQGVTGKNVQEPTKAEAKAIYSYDPKHQIPSVNVGGRWAFVGTGVVPGVISGLSWGQIAKTLANPKNAVAQHIDGAANVYTAAICSATGGMPSAVCDTPGVKAAAGRL